jgi:nitroreductase
VVVVGRLRNFADERDRHLIYIDSALAAMGFILALETLGLSSCMINWPDLPDKEGQMATLLALEPDERPVFLIAVGYADPSGKVARSVKKPVGELLVF